MKLEDVLHGPLLEPVKAGSLPDQVREILEAFGAHQDLGQLQVRACWDDLMARGRFRLGRGFAFVEARMLGLPVPALVMGFSKEHGASPGRTPGPAVAVPSLAGAFRPRLLVPPDRLERCSEEELRQVFLHELTHLKRRASASSSWMYSLYSLSVVAATIRISPRASTDLNTLAASDGAP